MERNKKIDIAKAIGIILVVLGHAGMPHSSIIFRFHMALFFALSGFCFSDRHIVSFKTLLSYIYNKIVGLYIPFVLFNGITLLLRGFLIKINVYTNDERFLQGTWGNAYGLTIPLSLHEMKPWLLNVFKFTGESQLGGATWFLRVLFGITVLWAVVNYIIKSVAKFNQQQCLIINVVISGMSLYIAFVWMKNGIHLPLQFETVMAVYSVYTAGYYLKVFNRNKSSIQNIVISILSFAILYYCDIRCSLNGWNCNVNEYANPFMYLVTSLSGIMLIFSVADIIGHLRYTKFFMYIGQHTLAILLWHFSAFKIVTYMQLMIFKEPIYRLASFPVFKSIGFWWIIYTVVGIIIPVLIAYVYSSFSRKMHSLSLNF